MSPEVAGRYSSRGRAEAGAQVLIDHAGRGLHGNTHMIGLREGGLLLQQEAVW
jgi:hypothetical protein